MKKMITLSLLAMTLVSQAHANRPGQTDASTQAEINAKVEAGKGGKVNPEALKMAKEANQTLDAIEKALGGKVVTGKERSNLLMNIALDSEIKEVIYQMAKDTNPDANRKKLNTVVLKGFAAIQSTKDRNKSAIEALGQKDPKQAARTMFVDVLGGQARGNDWTQAQLDKAIAFGDELVSVLSNKNSTNADIEAVAKKHSIDLQALYDLCNSKSPKKKA